LKTTNTHPKRISYGIIIIAAALMIQFIGWGTFNTFGLFVNQFQQDFGWSRALISGAASVTLLVHGAFSILMGNISDRYGPRLVMTACSIILALGTFLTSKVTAQWQLYLFWGVIVGIGASALDVVVLSTIARWFQKKRSIINGIVKTGAGLGQLTFPFITSAIILSGGWRNAYIALAVICLVLILTASQFLKRDPQKGHQNHDHNSTSVNQVAAEEGVTFKRALHLRQFWTVIAAYAVALFCTYTIQVHIAPHAIALSNSITQAAGMLSIIGAFSLVGRFVTGAIGDKIGNVKTMMGCCALLGITLFCLGFIRETWMFYLVLPVYGFGHGGIYSLISPTVAGLFGTGSHGAIYGVIIFGGTIGGALGPLLAGAIFDKTGNYSVVFFILSAVVVCGLALLATLKPVAARELKNG
jgi:MFS family permease